MKSKLASILCAASLLLIPAFTITAADLPKPKPASADLERMKTLVGTWKGKVDMGQGPVDMEIQYRVIAAGTVVEERTFPGTPNEMVSMYYDKEGKLAMTHYCMLGNRPEMRLKASDAKSLTFDFDPCCGIDTKKETHMHALKLNFDDADTITSTCKALAEGKEMEHKPTTLKRVSK